jgi:deoxyribonuclease V
MTWPATPAELVVEQERLAALRPGPYQFREGAAVGGCFVCFGRGGSGPGAPGDDGWAAAAIRSDRRWSEAVVEGISGWEYQAGLLALREGALLEAAVLALPRFPDVLLVDATGRDHPRRAGLALHLGAALEIPTVGVTHRPLLAAGDWPGDEAGAIAPLLLEDELVGHWLRTRHGTRPLAVHAAWRTDPETAVRIVVAVAGRFRTPAPLRRARRLARRTRSGTR